jgi:hypothetical protein
VDIDATAGECGSAGDAQRVCVGHTGKRGVGTGIVPANRSVVKTGEEGRVAAAARKGGVGETGFIVVAEEVQASSIVHPRCHDAIGEGRCRAGQNEFGGLEINQTEFSSGTGRTHRQGSLAAANDARGFEDDLAIGAIALQANASTAPDGDVSHSFAVHAAAGINEVDT